ncbi:MAG: phosphoribosylglycinamide formyltransferase [Actinomycetia bacterium]|nr:phosphoribosylglycinamide formyltransferase [Actinomycetes bacterium]
MSVEPLPIAVLISGSGSNLQALIDFSSDAFRIAVVISDREGVRGLERAVEAGIPTVVVTPDSREGRDGITEAICDAASGYGATALVLAGFMRVLGAYAIERFPLAIINVHPSLLPSFPGARAVEQALEHGVKLTGVTVHFVDEEVDHGPIITQRAVPVYETDDVASLHARIQHVEHSVLADVVDRFARGALGVSGRIVRDTVSHATEDGR